MAVRAIRRGATGQESVGGMVSKLTRKTYAGPDPLGPDPLGPLPWAMFRAIAKGALSLSRLMARISCAWVWLPWRRGYGAGAWCREGFFA